jgi:serine/threonine protein kinase
VLDRESGIKILDFGLVKSLHGDAELTRNGAIIGSPLYMAPSRAAARTSITAPTSTRWAARSTTC